MTITSQRSLDKIKNIISKMRFKLDTRQGNAKSTSFTTNLPLELSVLYVLRFYFLLIENFTLEHTGYNKTKDRPLTASSLDQFEPSESKTKTSSLGSHSTIVLRNFFVGLKALNQIFVASTKSKISGTLPRVVEMVQKFLEKFWLMRIFLLLVDNSYLMEMDTLGCYGEHSDGPISIYIF